MKSKKALAVVTGVLTLLICVCFLFFVNKDEESPADHTVTESASVYSEASVGGADAPEHVYETACGYCGHINDNSLYVSCLNSDKMIISSSQHLPVFRFDSTEQLDSFRMKYFERPKGYDSYDEMPFFDSTVSHCDEEFFKDNTLFAIYLTAPSGSFRYGVDKILNDGKSFLVNVVQTNDPEVYTTDVVSWIVTVSAKKEAVRNCTEFDAVLNS